MGARHGVYNENHGTSDMPPDDGRETAGPRAYLLDQYEAIARASNVMLEAARQSDWDEVGRQVEQCRTMIGALKAAAPQSPLPPAEDRRRMDLLRTILSNDAEIRDCTDPRLAELGRLVSCRPPSAETSR